MRRPKPIHIEFAILAAVVIAGYAIAFKSLFNG